VLPVRLVVCCVWSSAPTGNRPENSLAVAPWPLPLDGNVTVIVSAAVNGITLCAEQIIARPVVVVTGMSTSTL